MSTFLDQFKEHTIVVADTGDFESIKKYCPTDATTNPSLLLAASQLPQYKHLLDQVVYLFCLYFFLRELEQTNVKRGTKCSGYGLYGAVRIL